MRNGVQVENHRELEIAQQISTHLRGGTVRFAAGVSPFSMAFRACIMKCSAGDVDDTILINSSEPNNITYTQLAI